MPSGPAPHHLKFQLLSQQVAHWILKSCFLVDLCCFVREWFSLGVILSPVRHLTMSGDISAWLLELKGVPAMHVKALQGKDDPSPTASRAAVEKL